MRQNFLIRLSILFIFSAGHAQAQTIVQCVRSMLENTPQGLFLKTKVASVKDPTTGLSQLVLTRECLASGMQLGQVYALQGRVEYFFLTGKSSEGVLIHQFEPKVQLGIYSRMSYLAETPIEMQVNVYRHVASFNYQIFIQGSSYHESISWGRLTTGGDENAR